MILSLKKKEVQDMEKLSEQELKIKKLEQEIKKIESIKVDHWMK